MRVVPKCKTPQAVFEEMRSDALKKIGKDKISLPGFSLMPQQQNKQENVMQDASASALLVRGSRSQQTLPPSPPVAESSRAPQPQTTTDSRSKGRR